MPVSFNALDVHASLFSHGYNCDRSVDIGGNLVALGTGHLELTEGLETFSVLLENGVVPSPLVNVASEDTPKRGFRDS